MYKSKKITIFQGRGRPQGNGDKTDLRLFPKPALISGEQAKTTRNVTIEMAMDLCIDEKDEERETEAQSVVRAKKRARGGGRRMLKGRTLLRHHD